MVGFADSTGDVMKSPTVGCSRRLVLINSSTIPCSTPCASLSSPNWTVVDAALGWPPPPKGSKRSFKLTCFTFTPALTLPIIIMVDARFPASLSDSVLRLSTSNAKVTNSSKSICPSPSVSIASNMVLMDSSLEITPEDANAAPISDRSKYPDASISFLSNEACSRLLLRAISPPFHASASIMFCVSAGCFASKSWACIRISPSFLALLLFFLDPPDRASYTTESRNTSLLLSSNASCDTAASPFIKPSALKRTLDTVTP
mmetsp:Transcript_12385/g.17285  ORF Transcript_12385/g.17285 Transcript_12385/m.17285 type:complete len:260 (+) Transcript_12385:605-1384(+)